MNLGVSHSFTGSLHKPQSPWHAAHLTLGVGAVGVNKGDETSALEELLCWRGHAVNSQTSERGGRSPSSPKQLCDISHVTLTPPSRETIAV